jgi:hypothetical protein
MCRKRRDGDGLRNVTQRFAAAGGTNLSLCRRVGYTRPFLRATATAAARVSTPSLPRRFVV